MVGASLVTVMLMVWLAETGPLLSLTLKVTVRGATLGLSDKLR